MDSIDLTSILFGGDTEILAETPQDIDPELTRNDLLTVIYSEIKRKRIPGHHIKSFNDFVSTGINQIIKDLFAVEARFKNERTETADDQNITDIFFKITFDNVTLNKPSFRRIHNGTSCALLPHTARLNRLTYSAKLSVTAHITATAKYNTGVEETRTETVPNYQIATIPVMVRSKLCTTHGFSHGQLRDAFEDPHNEGGYFIIKGGEWGVDSLENLSNNSFHVYKNMHLNEICRGTFLSKPGDNFENSYQILLKYLDTGALTINITTNKNEELELPFYVIFRLCHITSDAQIMNYICYGVNNRDNISLQITRIVERAFEIEAVGFPGLRDTRDFAVILKTINTKLEQDIQVQDKNLDKYRNANFMSIIDKMIFPHIGTDARIRPRKMIFLGHLFNKLVRVAIGALESTDRDNYANKRIHAAGYSLAKAFKTNFNYTIVQQLRRSFVKAFKGASFKNVSLGTVFTTAITSDQLEKSMSQSITVGSKTITVKQTEVPNRVSSQIIYHKNDLNVKSIAGMINTPSSCSKQNERADEMRRVHPSYIGYVDPSQSVEGENVGMNKQMGCTASITRSTNQYVLKRRLSEDDAVIPLEQVVLSEITSRNMAKVFVNGDWLGCTMDAAKLCAQYRSLRRHNKINYTTTISWNIISHEIHFWTDVGRIIRPLIIVYNNIAEHDADPRVPFKQWILLTKRHIVELQTGQISIKDLRRQRVIEYITPEEQENCYIAAHLDILRQNANNVCEQYTHLEIEQSILGLVTLACPMAGHSNTNRITFNTVHRKQSCGWFALNWPYRVNDKNMFLQYYCENPPVKCFTDALTIPTAFNAVVAIALDQGFGQEDSLEINQTSIDLGMFNGSFITSERIEIDTRNDEIGTPDAATCADIKYGANYSMLVNGLIPEGAVVKRGDVIVGKYTRIREGSVNSANYTHRDSSFVYKSDEPAYIEKIVRCDDDEMPFITVKIRKTRPLAVGDKLSSRTGNKGIVSRKRPRTDMPYLEDGTVPDIIVNCHSIPTRMALNQLMEIVLGYKAVCTGSYVDATVFKETPIMEVVQELRDRWGLRYFGHRIMYNGITGQRKLVPIFVGINSYMRLQKFVRDDCYAMRSGPTNALTNQPLPGKNNDGGLRIGEMEKDCLVGSGKIRAFWEKLFEDSDGQDLYVCKCGEIAICNEKKNYYVCKRCRDNAQIQRVPSSHTANLFFNEAAAIGVKMQFELAPNVFSEAANMISAPATKKID